MRLTRRTLLATAAGALLAQHPPAKPHSAKRPYLADMHSHYAMFKPRLFGVDMRQHLLDTGTTLIAWSATDDHRWIGLTPQGYKQTREPAPGELWANFKQRLAGYDNKLQQWGLTKALAAADIDAALAGEPRVLLSTEGASFLEGQPERVAQAHGLGIRHMQLMHFIANPLGDHQTDEPRQGGLSATGVQVIAECRRLGIVVDLAHGTPALVDAALDAADIVPVWSHSFITRGSFDWTSPAYLARALPLASAKKIAARGGAVGLWTVRVARDPLYTVRSVASYADEIMRMCDWLGPEHVAFGTDMEGAGPAPILSDYADLREVVDNLGRRGLPEAVLHGICIGNYARIVKRAMTVA